MGFSHYRTQAVVLASQDRGEADRIFHLYTKDFGKLRAWAISERKITSKLRGGLEPWGHSEVEFIEGRNRKIIVDTASLHRYQAIRNNIEKIRCAGRVVSALDSLCKEEIPEQHIWFFLLHVLQILDTEEREQWDFELVYFYFLWNIFSLLGYQPFLEACKNCKRAVDLEKTYFFFSEGGILCRDCTKKKNIARALSQKIAIELSPFLLQTMRALTNQKMGENNLNAISMASQERSLLEELSSRYTAQLSVYSYES
ncbi:MAG: DNA repair protein RecO [Candidatus Wildermuthbacteria bacterium]|nr:DNA repair protein RecO [Candidatus Wildermuthbacteria bacterium]